MQSKVYYTCRKCGENLFCQTDVLHGGNNDDMGDRAGVSAAKASWSSQAGNYKFGVGGKCSSVFVSDIPEWAELSGNEGRICCPKCKSRVGAFSWSGAPCSCGKWVTPAFQFQLSRIDHKGVIDVTKLVRQSALNSSEPVANDKSTQTKV